jgi:hypothetical protein
LKRTVIFCTKFFEVVNRSRANPYQSRASSYQLAIGGSDFSNSRPFYWNF